MAATDAAMGERLERCRAQKMACVAGEAARNQICSAGSSQPACAFNPRPNVREFLHALVGTPITSKEQRTLQRG
jgi:hypothetical protein